MNVIDRAVAMISPEKALKRMQAKAKIDFIKNSGYSESGASRRKNSMKGWYADSRSPQDDIDQNLSLLRRRSRSLYMGGDPIGTGAIKTVRTNVIGQGLVVKPKINYKILGISREEATEIENQIKNEFKLWADSVFCDTTRQNNFYELQQLAFLNMLMNGEIFAGLTYDEEKPFMPYQLRIRLIEADRISTPDSVSDYVDLNKKAKNGNRIWNGIEIDKNGAVSAYYICNSYPSDYRTAKKEWVRIEPYGKLTGNPNMLHIFESERPDQYRGIPFLAPVIESLKQLSRYSEAELMAAVIGGMFTVFVKTNDGGENIDFEGFYEDEGEEKDAPEYKLGNGMVNYLQEGESIEVADPKRPNSNFDGFVTSFCKFIGTALEIPSDLLLKNFNASYSASRAALMEAWKVFRMRRNWFQNDFCQPIYEMFLSEAVSKERIIMPGFFMDVRYKKAYCNATWNGPAPGQLDPVKEVQAAKLRVDGCFSTIERESTEINGSDFDYNVEQRCMEEEIMEKAGLKGEKQ